MAKKAKKEKQTREFEYNGKTYPSRAAVIRELADKGMTISEIAKELNVKYQVVWQTLKGPELRAKKKAKAEVEETETEPAMV